MADMQWFYSKSKVPICLAITDRLHFLNKLQATGILSEEESLELQGDTRSTNRVVYECLCSLEENHLNIEHFFEVLFQKSFLKKYPDLKSIHAEFKEGKYRDGAYSTTDKDKDPLIFAQEKVRISLTITDRFPFLHGLQDLTILSESESLKLQADERPVARIIYESLSLIEKKDMKLNIVFEYIFQECFLKLYPGLQDILQEPSGEFVAPFNGDQYPMFDIASDLLEFFEHSKTYICEAVSELFPFLHGLHDLGLLSHVQLLKLQADKRSIKEVLYEALCHIKTTSNIETFFAYVFQEFYLKLYPSLRISFQCFQEAGGKLNHVTSQGLNAALTMDVCPSTPEKLTDIQDSNTSITVTVKNEIVDAAVHNSGTPYTEVYENEVSQMQEQDTSKDFTEIQVDKNLEPPKLENNEPSTGSDVIPAVSYESKARELQEQEIKEPLPGSGVILPPPIRRCRMQPINYSEPPDLFLEGNNEDCGEEKLHRRKSGKREAPEPSIDAHTNGSLDVMETSEPGQAPRKYTRRKSGQREAQETPVYAHENCSLNVQEKTESRLDTLTKPSIVKLEFPKQVFNENFKVRCGDKIGIFKKSLWTGDARNDMCICCDGRQFTVSKFEVYGGRGASKSWKRSIHCEEIKMECLLKAGILKPSIRSSTHK